MDVVYANQTPPDTYSKSIFLAGPTPRGQLTESWRPEAIKVLESLGYDGVVFVPEDEHSKWKHSYIEQVEWEDRSLNAADCIVFWVPRDLTPRAGLHDKNTALAMPAFTTNVEWGMWCDSGKVVLGYPEGAPKMRFLHHYASKWKAPVATSLTATLSAALTFIGEGAERTGGERSVPAYIWNTPHFQEWYDAQKGSHNRLDDARVVWVFRVGPDLSTVFYWALHVDVYVDSEDRNKTNEVVLSRPDISTIVAFCRGPKGSFESHMLGTKVLLVREFRSPASTFDAFIRELPGGSSHKDGVEPAQLAAEELEEETGLSIFVDQLRFLGKRQLTGTLSAHKAHVYSVELTEEQFEWLAGQEEPRGVEEDSERTYVEITTVGELLECWDVDWAHSGMILTALLKES